MKSGNSLSFTFTSSWISLSEAQRNDGSMPSEPVSPFKTLWQRNYPFSYWYNRLEKINPYNEYDRMEALYSLVQLTDIYAHIFAAYAQNPELPWFFVKENTFRRDIDNVLEQLSSEGMATVGALSDDPEGLTTIEARDEYELHDLDAIAGALLGCPFTFDEESDSVNFDESPDIHRGVCNAILDFAANNTALLNDFKHGFRVLPVTPEDIDMVLESTTRMDEADEDAIEERLEELGETLAEDSWGFCFARMSTESTEYGHKVHLDIFHVDAWSCLKFAELTLDALYNLITVHGGVHLEDSLMEIPELVVEGESTIIEHIFGIATPLRSDPDVVVTEEEFSSE